MLLTSRLPKVDVFSGEHLLRLAKQGLLEKVLFT